MMDDLIYRQAAKDMIKNHKSDFSTEKDQRTAMACVNAVPSAQPYTDAEIQKMQDLEQAQIQKAYELGREDALSEIIRCKDCKWFGDIGCAISIVDDSDKPTENDFCSYAERRTDDLQ